MKTESFTKKFFCFKSHIQFILLCILLFMSWSGVSAQQMKEWTVIVYMNGGTFEYSPDGARGS